MGREISNPWAVYHDRDGCARGLGRVIKDGDVVAVNFRESSDDPDLWKAEDLKRFQNPREALIYWCDHLGGTYTDTREGDYKEVRLQFLTLFPNENVPEGLSDAA